ncbi:MAG: phytoene/squalene synthase family protein [Bacteroidales bacterium]|nr:phytoene/squalene synthase family protein [Bacteroidales bacterium]
MKSIFDNVSAKASQQATRMYSTSFSLGIMFFKKPIRKPIYAIYGFVRLADEIVDSFNDYDKNALFKRFKEDVELAIRYRISTNPLLNSFQEAVHTWEIDMELIDLFLKSMEMDLNKQSYTSQEFNNYILGSAEVVGLMCLKVFCEGKQSEFEKLKPYAMKLGAAFQKVNFLRDLKADYDALGRSYFPGLDLGRFSLSQKKAIEADIANDFAMGLKGIKMLPATSLLGVYMAYVYYLMLFRKIKRTRPEIIKNSRIRISNFFKLVLMLNRW